MNIARLLHRFLVRQTMPFWAVTYYDRMIEALAHVYLGPLADRICKAFPGPIHILDVGTGTGQLPIMLARKNHQYRITGVDLSESCLRIGGKKAAAAGVGDHIEFICAGAEDIPLEPGSVNLVVSTCSLHHWRYPVCILRKVSGLLADKGEIWIMDDWQDASHEDRKKWVELVEGIAGAGILFKCVFWFESRYLAYSQYELERLCEKADLSLFEFSSEGVFFLIRIGMHT